MGLAMSAIVKQQIEHNIAWIMMDDGDKNVISPTMIDQLNAALDQAEKAGAVVVLTGRQEVFSAGFDLQVFKSKNPKLIMRMLMGGFKLSKRLLSFPTPVIIACNGHAIAMGAFLLLSGDHRIGVDGEFKVVANEVQIGLTMPYSAIEICRQRLNRSHCERAMNLSALYNPETAIEAGFLDQVVAPKDLNATAQMWAKHFNGLDLAAHTASKKRNRKALIKALGWAIHKDRLDFLWQGLKQAMGQKKSKR